MLYQLGDNSIRKLTECEMPCQLGDNSIRKLTDPVRDPVRAQDPDRQVQRRENQAVRRIPKEVTMQTWDYEKPCPFCGCIWLKSEKTRNMCCKGGTWIGPESNYPILQPLPDFIRNIALTRIEHMSRRSAFYNGIFSICITGVDNGRSGVGFEQRNMLSAVVLNGRTYAL